MKRLIPMLVFLICLQTVSIFAQDANVVKVAAVTAENVTFEAWIANQRINLGDPIHVNYKIANKSKRPIFVVTKNIDNKLIVEDDKIVFPRPFVLVSGHEAYDYSFKRINAGESTSGLLTITAAEYRDSRSWSVTVGLGFVFDLEGLTPKSKEIRDPIPFKQLLSSRLRTIALGPLSTLVVGN